jgi:photosystem II stability/assembly factor-like uncharacterized protein
MKTIFSKLIFTAAGACLLGGALLSVQTSKNPAVAKEQMREGKEEGAEAAGYLNWMRERYADPITGEYNIEAIAASRQSLANYRANAKNTRAFQQMDWVERGPNDVGGRMRDVLIDKTNPNKLYAVAAGGGLFVSTNAGDTWAVHPNTDTFSSLQGSSIAQSVSGTIYFATGEGYGNLGNNALIRGASALPGDGIFKSTDGGVSFKQLPTTRPATNSNSGWAYIKKVVCHPTLDSVVYAGTEGGLRKSVNAGLTWTSVAGLSNSITDIEFTPNGNMIVGTVSGIFVSTNGGTSFTNKWNAASGLGGPTTRTELAIAPSNPDHVYLIAITPGSGLKAIYQSTDFGTSWITMKSGGGSFDPFATSPPNPIFQGFWGVCIAVHPTNENEFYVGGMTDLYRYTPANDFQSVAYSNGSVASGVSVHADMHGLTYDVNNPNILYIATDGGMYKSFNASAPNPGFTEKNDGMNTLQALMFDVNQYDKIISGAQDNGTSITGVIANSPLGSRQVGGGDGGICAFSRIFADVAFGSVSYNSDLDRSTSSYHTFASFNDKTVYNRNIDGGLQWDGTISKWVNTTTTANGRPDDQEVAANDPIWSMPMDLEEKIDTATKKKYSVMVIGTYNNLWITQQASDPSISTPTWVNLGINTNSGTVVGSIFNGRRFSAVHISKDGKAVYAASSTNGRIYRVSGLDLFKKKYEYDSTSVFWNNAGVVVEDLGVAFSGTITSLCTDETDGEDLIVTTSNYGTFANYVSKISMAKTGAVPRTAVSIVNNLPMMPVNSATYVPGYGKNRIILGTESGVWGSDNAGATWVELNNMGNDPKKWHPRVPVTKVICQELVSSAGPVLFSGTHGRGMWSSYSMATMFPTKVTDIVKDADFNLYPNPAANSINISMTSSSASKAFIQIIGLNGTVAYSFTTGISAGENKIPVSLQNLAQGGYIMSIVANGQRMVKTFIKQ